MSLGRGAALAEVRSQVMAATPVDQVIGYFHTQSIYSCQTETAGG